MCIVYSNVHRPPAYQNHAVYTETESRNFNILKPAGFVHNREFMRPGFCRRHALRRSLAYSILRITNIWEETQFMQNPKDTDLKQIYMKLVAINTM